MSEKNLVFLDAGTIGEDIQWPDFGKFGKVIAHDRTKAEQVAERVSDADMLFTNKVSITAEHIAAAPGLKYIGVLATGYNLVDIRAAAERGIPVCNVPSYSTPSVVQHVFTLMFALCSRVCSLAGSVRRGDWGSCEYFSYWDKPIVEVEGKTLGVVGFGDIGSHVARIGNAFGMRVLAYTPRPKAAPGYEAFAFVSLEELFRESDVITLHCPLTPENTGMINSSLLRTMKKSAFLINTARGPLVNEEDLVQALEQGVIAGAGLDVVSREPMPDDNPLRLAQNCIVTPHVAWAGYESRVRLMRQACDNVKAFLDGSPVNVVNGV